MKEVIYTFYFEEGHIVSERLQEDEDARMVKALNKSSTKLITFPHSKAQATVNLEKVKCFTREELDPLPLV